MIPSRKVSRVFADSGEYNFDLFFFFVVKKAYYKLSRLVHPDRVPASLKEISTEKFKILSKLYTTLTDKDKKALYDEQGVIADDDDDDSKLSGWLNMWKMFFKPISIDDIKKFEQEYKGKDTKIDIWL